MKKVVTFMGIRLTKLLPILIISAILIGGVSAAVYNIMYVQVQQIPAEAPKVYFVSGTDSTSAGAAIGTNATYVKFNSMAGWPNSTRFYEDSVGIINNDASSRAVELSFDSWSGDTNYVTISVKVFNAGSVQQGNTISVGTGGSSTGSISIPAGQTFRVQWEIKWNAGALSSYRVNVLLQLRATGE